MEYASFLSNIAVGDKVQVIAEDGGRFSHYTTSSEGEKAVKKVTRDFIFIGGSKFSRKDGIIKGQFLREVSIWPSEEYRTKHLEMLSSMQ